MRRFEVLKGMHLGPIRTNITEGDVIGWDEATKLMTINGAKLGSSNGHTDHIDGAVGITVLLRQADQNPENPWIKELDPVDISTSVPIVTGTQVLLPILGCLQAAEDFLKLKDSKWIPDNEEQHVFINRYMKAKQFVDKLGDNLKRKASTNVEEINAWLKENGFDIKLKPEGGRHFAVASILDVLVNWLKEGTISAVYNQDSGKQYPAVSLENKDRDHFRCVEGYLDRKIHPYPVAQVNTLTGDQVFMSVLDFMPEDTFAITQKVEKLQGVVTRIPTMKLDGLKFPMVDYNQMVDIDWIKNMATDGGNWYVGQAIQQTKFRMNEKGARAESAAAMTMRCMSMGPAKEWIVIDKPFILWIERVGVAIPLFSGVFSYDSWKKPEGLN
jgi:hypothetical protein